LRILIHAASGAPAEGALAASPFGPFEVLRCVDAAQVQAQLDVIGADALLVDAEHAMGALRVGKPLAVIGLGRPAPAVAIDGLQHGVQDYVADDELDSLGLRVRAAVERARSADEARRAFGIDLTTGLPHERQLMEHLSQVIALRERQPAPMALVVLRIEGLAVTQARLGAEAANVLRRKVAVRLRSSVRASDVVAALRGDTFAVLLVSMLAATDAERVAQKMRAALAAPFQVAGSDVAIGVALGVAQHPDDGAQGSVLLQRAMGLAASSTAVGRGGQTLDAANDG
jgi:diguanylate cyclase (GGDEF)-like protein